MAAIDQDVAAGNLDRWEQVCNILEPYTQGDHRYEGQELEPAAKPDEEHWNDDEVHSNEDGGDDQGGGDSTGAVVANFASCLRPGACLGTVSLEDALTSYASMLEIAKRPGSGVDQGALLYFEMKHATVSKALHNMEHNAGEKTTFKHIQEEAVLHTQTLKALHNDVRVEDKQDKQDKKDNKGKKDK